MTGFYDQARLKSELKRKMYCEKCDAGVEGKLIKSIKLEESKAICEFCGSEVY